MFLPLYLVCMYVCLMPYFSNTVSLYPKMKVPTALVYRTDFYMYKILKSLWHQLLTAIAARPTAAFL